MSYASPCSRHDLYGQKAGRMDCGRRHRNANFVLHFNDGPFRLEITTSAIRSPEIPPLQHHSAMTRRISPLPPYYPHPTQPPPSQIITLRHPPIIRRPSDPLFNRAHSNMGVAPLPWGALAASFERGYILDVVQ